MDIGAWAMKSPASYYDFMTYCNPDWVSDYFYKAILDYRDPGEVVLGSGQAEPSLLVWGRVEARSVVLEPAFEVVTVPVLPSGSGDFLLEGLDEWGESRFAMGFQPVPVAHAEEGDGHFAFAIPLRLLDLTSLRSLRVTGNGYAPGITESRVRPAFVSPSEPQLSHRGGSSFELAWDSASFPMALVRDPGTGEVLSFARGGTANLTLSPGEIEIVFSDGLQNSGRVRHRVR
jgi:hypothetical protein